MNSQNRPRRIRRIQRLMALAAAFILCATADVQAKGDPKTGQEKAKRCAACHGIDGIARLPNAPHIAGESILYLRKQLKAFRSGERKQPQMAVIAKSLSDQDIEDLAAYFSAITITATPPSFK